MINTDICIIGAGPVGLFAVFEAGLLRMRCHLIDALPQVGGQLSEIYPHKPIYDIPGLPAINAQELVDNLMEQIQPFHPTFTLGERVEALERQEDGSYFVVGSEHTVIHAHVVVIAGGSGSFEPRKPDIPGLSAFEGHGVSYMVRNPEHYRNKRIVIAGGVIPRWTGPCSLVISPGKLRWCTGAIASAAHRTPRKRCSLWQNVEKYGCFSSITSAACTATARSAG